MLSLILLSLGLCVSASPLARRQTSPPIPSNVPSFVYEYAPIVYLYSGENYLPSDIGAQVTNTHPTINFTSVTGAPSPLTLSNLDSLNNGPNAAGGSNVYLSSNLNIATFPAYLNGVKPDSAGKTNGAVSCAIIVNSHPNSTITDVFYMYFYAFNYGGTYYTLTVDDHIGDWEHNMQRFVNGTPSQMWFSQHSGGEAFTYSALEKSTAFPNRPLTYSANGTHANYATSGAHDHTIPGLDLPFGPIEDHTDQGSVWDPTLSAYYYSYDAASNTYTAYDGVSPTEWLYFKGQWGDQQLPKTDPRQSCPFGISALCKWSGGPTGPEDKQLNRTTVCPNSQKNCNVMSVLLPGE